ncbi:unnamed protein product, partial [marine sediment metagenome]
VKGEVSEVEAFLKQKGKLLGTQPEADGWCSYNLKLNAESSSQQLARDIIGKQWELSELRKNIESLESIFLSVTMK